MFVIGITGGIGCGKSTAAQYFRRRGVPVLDADQISREVTAPGGSAVNEVIDHFGPDIQDEEGHIDRAALAKLVFNHRKALDELSFIVHEHVMQTIMDEYKKYEEVDEKVLVLDVPIPVEVGFLDISDQVMIIWADDDVRYERLEQRGLPREEASDRIAMQMTKEEYQALGDLVIDNSGTLEDLEEALDAYVESELHSRGIRLEEVEQVPDVEQDMVVEPTTDVEQDLSDKQALDVEAE